MKNTDAAGVSVYWITFSSLYDYMRVCHLNFFSFSLKVPVFL